MRFVVLGAGALGSILAGLLARAGEDVTVIARGHRASYLQQQGITITGLADFTITCPVVTDPMKLHGADVLIVAVKTYDMAAALAPLRHLDVATVLSVQNGVRKNEQLAHAFGAGKTVGAVALFAGEGLPAGPVQFTINQGLYVGELPEGTSERVEQLVATLARAGIQAEAAAHIQTVEWSKFVGWVGHLVLSVLTRLESYKYCSDPDIALVGTRLMRETAALAMERGIELQDIPPFYLVKTICSGTEPEAVEQLQELGTLLQVRAPTARASSLQDLERGRQLEVEETLGYVVANAATAGLAVPTVDTCYRLISGINRCVGRGSG
jgi:2-dehydropantoate 2-reductase